MSFNASEYQNQIITQIQSFLDKNQKLYLELVGNCTDQSDFSRLIPGFPSDMRKKTFAHFKYDMDIFFCIRAEDVLNEDKVWQDGKDFKSFLTIYLKKIENQYWVKPHIVINWINVENMYDLIFSFETYFQKLWYRVWEKYKIKAYETPLSRLLSEDGFGNDDHIPTSKKLIVICGLTPESGKLTTATAQIYQDLEIWIQSGYAKLDPLPNYDEEKDSNRNLATKARDLCALHEYWLDDEIENRDVFAKCDEKFWFFKKFSEKLWIDVPKAIKDYTVWTINISDDEIQNSVKSFIDEWIKNADSPLLQEKLLLLQI